MNQNSMAVPAVPAHRNSGHAYVARSGRLETPPRAPTLPATPARAGFFGDLFDFNFTTFVMTRVVKVLYLCSRSWASR